MGLSSPSYRMDRLQEEILHQIRLTLLYDTNEALFQELTLTRVLVTRDLGIARVYFDVDETKHTRAQVLEVLNRYRGVVRKRLGNELRLRQVPQVEFFFDDTEEERSRIEALFSQLNPKQTSK